MFGNLFPSHDQEAFKQDALNYYTYTGVAASVLNRVLSDKFPNTVSGVIFSPGQYQGLDFKSYIVPNPSLVNKLSSPTGKNNIAYWSGVLDGRTDFKGQSMLPYRVSSEDPMCHPKGNFYHYYWQ